MAELSRNDPCWCGSGLKWKKCHYPNPPPQDFQSLVQHYHKQYGILLKNAEQIEGIRAACYMAASILDKTCKMAKSGVSTEELDDYAHELHRQAMAIPAPLGFGQPPFPKSICTSVNDVICHGIPNATALKEGDILNVDVSCIYQGYFGDCGRMVMIGNVSEEKKRVVDVSYAALMRSIALLKPGVLINVIGKCIEEYAKRHGCTTADEFSGHGIGLYFREPPEIPHHSTSIAIPLAEGMTFTIEPMINAGKSKSFIDPADDWTARTIDGKPSAQWEHTVLITKTGCEILTPFEIQS
ncbi:MAG TPA: methionyl aminopeptidase [Rhabdochlamydiaceae bacterium]|jgi:methionyl aminopeptidase